MGAQRRADYLLTRPHAAVTIARLAAPKSMCTSGCEKWTTFRLNDGHAICNSKAETGLRKSLSLFDPVVMPFTKADS